MTAKDIARVILTTPYLLLPTLVMVGLPVLYYLMSEPVTVKLVVEKHYITYYKGRTDKPRYHTLLRKENGEVIDWQGLARDEYSVPVGDTITKKTRRLKF
jgi:hypothetical protein